MSLRVEKVLQEWPLSKVELVTDGNEQFVRKSVHRDLGHEAVKQQAIYEVADGFAIPKILDVSEANKRTVITMEYVEPTRETTVNDAETVLERFHSATEPLVSSGLFPHYTLDSLDEDLQTVRQYGELPNEVNPEFFEDIFGNQTILHGDWALDQILVHNEMGTIIDFARSQVGPRILDKGHMLRFETDDFESCTDPDLLKACVVADVQRMAWFDLCKRQYIKKYGYKKEMQAGIDGINTALRNLGDL